MVWCEKDTYKVGTPWDKDMDSPSSAVVMQDFTDHRMGILLRGTEISRRKSCSVINFKSFQDPRQICQRHP